MTYKYDPKKFITLIEKEKNLDKQYHYLPKEYRSLHIGEELQLKDYIGQFLTTIFWTKLEEFLVLIEDFLNSKIDADTFDIEYYQLYQKTSQLCQLSLTTVEIVKRSRVNSKSFGLLSILQSISSKCNLFEFSNDNDDNWNEDNLRISIKDDYQILLTYELPTSSEKIFYGIQDSNQILASSEALINRSFSILKAVSLIFLSLLVIPY